MKNACKVEIYMIQFILRKLLEMSNIRKEAIAYERYSETSRGYGVRKEKQKN